MPFHPADPMILLYNPIEKLEKLALSAGIPYTPDQILDIGMTVLKNTRDFEQALGDWTAKPAANKTWAHFKDHFTNAQKQLKAIWGPTMQQAGYHHANMLAAQMRTDMDNRNSDLMSLLQTAIDTQSHGSPTTPNTAVHTITPGNHQVNASTTDQVQLEILKILQQL